MPRFFDAARGFSSFARGEAKDKVASAGDVIDSARTATATWLQPSSQRRGNWWLPLLLGLGLGAFIAFWWDPQRGHARRSAWRQRFEGAARRTSRSASRSLHTASSQARGTFAGIIHVEDESKEYNDATLAEKVESELFRDPSIPKGSININAERGVVVLRGQVEPAQVELIADRTRHISGVVDVDNRLKASR